MCIFRFESEPLCKNMITYLKKETESPYQIYITRKHRHILTLRACDTGIRMAHHARHLQCFSPGATPAVLTARQMTRVY